MKIPSKFDDLIYVYIFGIINKKEIRIFESKSFWKFLIVSKGPKNQQKKYMSKNMKIKNFTYIDKLELWKVLISHFS